MSLRTSLNLDFVRMGRVTGPLYDTEAKKLDPLLTFSRASSATRFNSSGVLETVGSGVPRFDFDPVTLQCRGLLMEEARTNLILHSADIANNVWVRGFNASVTSNYAAAPDGTNTADRLVFDGTQFGQIYQIVSGLVPGSVYTFSFWVKTDGTAQIAQMAYISGPVATLTYTPTANWQRITVTFTANDTSHAVLITTVDQACSFLAWGAQLELGPFATSYIPTTDAAATRAGESCDASTVVPWLNTQEGTVLAEFVCHLGTLQGPVPFYMGPGAYCYVGPTSATHGTPYVNDYSLSPGAGAVQYGAVTKLGLKYSPTRGTVGINGAAVVPQDQALLSLSFLSLGHVSNGNRLNGHLRRFTYLPHALSDLTLKALTQ